MSIYPPIVTLIANNEEETKACSKNMSKIKHIIKRPITKLLL